MKGKGIVLGDELCLNYCMDADLLVLELHLELAEPLMELGDDGLDEVDAKWALGLFGRKVLPLAG